MIRQARQTTWRGTNLPDATIAAMYADYLQVRSLAKCGKLWSRKRSTMQHLFETRGLPLYGKNFQPVVEHDGERFTLQQNCRGIKYYRGTTKRHRAYLHQVLWEEAHGSIPAGFKVCFKDGNSANCVPENLELLSDSDHSRKNAGQNGYTKSAKVRLAVLVKSFNGDKSVAINLGARRLETRLETDGNADKTARPRSQSSSERRAA
jgi:hypothetical protein